MAATPVDATEPHAAEPAPAPMQFVAHAGAVVSPGFGATAAVDTRVVQGLHLGVQGGFFTDNANAYPFGGARASYRIEATKTIRIVPTLGVAHVQVLKQDIDDSRVKKQAPVSLTAGLELALQLGHFVAGCDLQVMPTHITTESFNGFGSELQEKTLYLMPASLFVGAAF